MSEPKRLSDERMAEIDKLLQDCADGELYGAEGIIAAADEVLAEVKALKAEQSRWMTTGLSYVCSQCGGIAMDNCDDLFIRSDDVLECSECGGETTVMLLTTNNYVACCKFLAQFPLKKRKPHFSFDALECINCGHWISVQMRKGKDQCPLCKCKPFLSPP